VVLHVFVCPKETNKNEQEHIHRQDIGFSIKLTNCFLPPKTATLELTRETKKLKNEVT